MCLLKKFVCKLVLYTVARAHTHTNIKRLLFMIYYYKSKCLAVANMTLLIRIGYYYNNLVRYQLGKQFEIVFDTALLRAQFALF